MKKNLFLSIIMTMVMAMMFISTSMAFAETTLADVQARLAEARKKASGITTLEDVQAMIAVARKNTELQRIQKIQNEFKGQELHALRLGEGDTIGEIAKVVSGAGLRNISYIVTGNGLTMEECKNLKSGFVFYIPTKMISKELLLNAYEVAKFQKQLRVLESANIQLKEELVVATAELEVSGKIIDTLNKKIAGQGEIIKQQEVQIGSLEKSLITANETIFMQKEKLTVMEALTQNSSLRDLVLYTLAAILILALLIKLLIILFKKNKKSVVSSKEAEETEETKSVMAEEIEAVEMAEGVEIQLAEKQDLKTQLVAEAKAELKKEFHKLINPDTNKKVKNQERTDEEAANMSNSLTPSAA